MCVGECVFLCACLCLLACYVELCILGCVYWCVHDGVCVLEGVFFVLAFLVYTCRSVRVSPCVLVCVLV